MPCLAVRRPGSASLVRNRRPYTRPYTTLNSTCSVYLAYRCCSGFTALVPPTTSSKISPRKQYILLGFRLGVWIQSVIVHGTDRYPTPGTPRMTHSRPGPPRYGTPAAPAPFHKMELVLGIPGAQANGLRALARLGQVTSWVVCRICI